MFLCFHSHQTGRYLTAAAASLLSSVSISSLGAQAGLSTVHPPRGGGWALMVAKADCEGGRMGSYGGKGGLRGDKRDMEKGSGSEFQF